MATLQNIGKIKYRGKDGQWHPLPVVVQDTGCGVSTISGKGAPTSETQGEVNQLYRDEDTQRLYICTSTDGGYTWSEVSGGGSGGGSVDVDATLTKAGQAADAKAAGDAIGKKIDKAQGVENAGKILGIGNDGNVVPQDKPVQALAGASAPTTATVGVVGQEYYVIANNAVTEMYVCTAVANGAYTWGKDEFGAEIDDNSTEPTKVWSAEKCNQLSEEKVSLPKDTTGNVITGTAGWYAVSDGAGGITWVESAPSTGGGGETTTHGIVWDLANVTSSNNAVSVADGASLVAVLTASDGYTLGDVTVTMGGEVLTGVWNADTSTVTIASVTGDVIISCAGVEQGTGEVIDTSPVIEQTDHAYYTASTTNPNVTLRASAGQCVTKIYEFTPDVAAIEAHESYDAGLGYITAINGMAGFSCYIPSAKYIAAGNTEKSTPYKKAAYFVDGVLQTTLYNNLLQQSSENYNTFGVNKNVLQKTVNGIAFTLYTADVEDSYAYWSNINSSGTEISSAVFPQGVKNGDVIFAGKNTPYYGMKNIYGTTAGDTASELSVDDDYAQNYAVVTASVLGEDVGDSAEYGISAEFAAVIDNARKAWMTEYNGDYRKIPLIAHTDQHGHLSLATSHKLFKYLGATINWYSVSKVMNLGDTVSVEWYDADTEKPLLTCTQLEEAVECLKPVPFSKRLEVFGNHDTWYGDYETEGNTIGTRYPSTQAHLEQYFRNIYARRTNNNGWFVVHDDSFNVKYLVISGFEYSGGVTSRIGTKQMAFIIDEMKKNDGYDIIIISHVPIYYAVDTTIYPTGMTDSNGAGTVIRVAQIDTDALFNARKNKTSGTVTDSDGIVHTYDFSGCTTDVLCNISGHIHIDGYNYVANADDGLLSVTLDRFVDGCIHFVLVDRANRLVNVWKINNPDDTPQVQNYQIPFDKPTT